MVLIDSFPIIRIFRAFVNPFLLFGLHFSLFFFAYNLPVCHLPAQENVLYSMYLSSHRNWENLAVTSYQYRAVSACITDALHAFYMPDIRRFTMKMKSGNERKKIIRELLNRTDQEFTDEELIHQLIMTNITENSNETEKLSFGQRASDAVAKFAGSWAFIFSFIAVMVGWMAVNVILGTKAFDAYPFILLNLVLSCIAAIQAPLIMMSQNRQEAKDRQRAENDFKVNLKSELIIDDLHKKMDLIIENQKKINHRLDMLEQTGKAIDTPKAGSPIHNA